MLEARIYYILAHPTWLAQEKADSSMDTTRKQNPFVAVADVLARVLLVPQRMRVP